MRPRLRSDLSQAELAASLNRPKSWVSKVKVGERRLELEELRKVHVTLDADLLKLVRPWPGRSDATRRQHRPSRRR